MKETKDFTDYIEISWHEVCEDYGLDNGDISPCQQDRVDSAIHEINEVINEFVEQNKKVDTVDTMDKQEAAEFLNWILDDNIARLCEDTYIEQTTQWKKTFTADELINFYMKEFINQQK